MFETDLIPQSFVKACNAMDEIWVPSEFSRRSFAASGVDPSKLRVVAEGINTTWFDPSRYQPIELPKGTLVFGTAPQPQGSSSSSSSSKDSAAAAASDAKSKSKATEDATAAAGSESSSSSSSTFRFFSNGKWEPRKGYDILLDAYFAAFR